MKSDEVNLDNINETVSINSWIDYWAVFNILLAKLEARNKVLIIEELKEAQKYVNGFTDGWFEFKHALEKVIGQHEQDFACEEKTIAGLLIGTLNQNL